MEGFSSFVNTSLDLNINPNYPHPLSLSLSLVGMQDEPIHTNHEPIKQAADQIANGAALMEELNRMNTENKKLTEKLTVVYEDYKALRNQLEDYNHNHTNLQSSASSSCKRRRKADENGGNSSGGSSSDEEQSYKRTREEDEVDGIKSKITTTYMQTQPSDTSNSLVVKDGYQWRKYGQKVTRDNPSPRAYFKCSFAPTCPVKKKVQRSVKDPTLLVATYEGEHNHPYTTTITKQKNQNQNQNQKPVVVLGKKSNGIQQNKSLEKTKPSLPTTTILSSSEVVQSILVEQMASSLTKDQSFKDALQAAISQWFLHNNTKNINHIEK